MRKPPITPEDRSKILKWTREVALGMIGFGAVLLLSAGKWDWLWGWVYILILSAAVAAHVIVVAPINPRVMVDRSGGLRQPGAKRWDIWLAMSASLAWVAVMVVGGLDERWSWSGRMPLWAHLAGACLFITGWVFFVWAMACNPFFSESVRIQPDQRVANRGPYRLVRHPGYLGNLIGCLGQPFLLGSWWAFIPAILTMAAFTLRTELEDRTLLAGLEGYPEYARRVRRRLIPGIW